jgi:hypothetical protein
MAKELRAFGRSCRPFLSGFAPFTVQSIEKNVSGKKGWAARAMPESPPAPLGTAHPSLSKKENALSD